MSLLERMHPRSCLSGDLMTSVGRRDGDSPSKKRKALHDRVAQLLLDIDPSPRPRSSTSNDVSTAQRDDESDATNTVEKKSTVRRRRLGAIKSLYKLSNDRGNRMPLLCTSTVDVMPVLITCLQLPKDEQTPKPHEDDAEIRRLSCLTLNNLSTPMENKAVMVLGQHSHRLVETLLHVIETASPESHLCMICLYNLSFLEDGVDVLLNYCPGEERQHQPTSVEASSGYACTAEANDDDGSASLGSKVSRRRHRHHRIGATAIPTSPLQQDETDLSWPALQNDHSLLRVLEAMVRTYSPFLQSTVTSVERETIRWTVGMLCNFCRDTRKVQRIALILQTELIPCVIQNLKTTIRPMNQWTAESLEEFTLTLLCHLAKIETGRIALSKMGALGAIEPIIGKGGIHDHRAGIIRGALVGGEEGGGNEGGETYAGIRQSDTMAEF